MSGVLPTGRDNDEMREGAKCPSTLPGQESITAREEPAAGLVRSRRWTRGHASSDGGRRLSNQVRSG